ncbi:DNA-binding transcriptional regulator, PadR family [Austwickia chelonae]|uniref:Putative PadR family transcriptional regulator n=1 Tax=Austwickia chelonae NBRC 105200 TaxID=1184607 RepID=K6VAI5_9MICO|nr:PadR family transcriptional regulator [Austwickia chelonae]GAB79253.1 putative PadR family transcriptional regulator [Austwickia chelonae NBRC 105200]SEW37618.1 DNA-binding transcriptional regulator, PadR family [Austwickia chelonae]
MHPHDDHTRRHPPRQPWDPFGPEYRALAGLLGSFGQTGTTHRGPKAGHHRNGRARRGDIRLAILGLLAEEDLNGYQIIRTLEERTDGHWRPSPGAIYPALSQLEDEELITPAEGTGKMYTLTDAGRAHVDELGHRARAWEKPSTDGPPEPEPTPSGNTELWVTFGQLALAVRSVSSSGDPHINRAARELLEESRRQLHSLLAEDPDRHRTKPEDDDHHDGPHYRP